MSSETEGVPSLGGENIDADGKMSYANVNRISPVYARLMNKGKLKSGDTLINKDGAQTGKVAQYDGAFPEAWINEHVFIVRAKPGEIDPDYLFYTMLDSRAQGQIARRITGSAQPGLNSDFATAVSVNLSCDIAIQARIVRVLQALDTQIEATEALIAKQERVRAGLMQDLFTRGVDENSQLRPPRLQAPHLYHQTELGWLPLDWEVRPASKLCSAVIDCKNRTPPITSEGHPVFRTPNVRNGKFVATGLVLTDPASHREWTRRGQPFPGDILVTP